MNVDVVTIFDVVGARYENHRKAKHVQQTPHLDRSERGTGGIVLKVLRVQSARSGRECLVPAKVQQRPFVAGAAAANGAEGSRQGGGLGVFGFVPSRAEVTGNSGRSDSESLRQNSGPGWQPEITGLNLAAGVFGDARPKSAGSPSRRVRRGDSGSEPTSPAHTGTAMRAPCGR